MMQLTLGPILFFWPAQMVQDFYRQAAKWPAQTLYLGEVVCSRRQQLRTKDWLALAHELISEHRKTIILSSQALLESESDLKRLRQLIDQGTLHIEANDLSCVKLAHEKKLPFVAGPYLNIYNVDTLRLFKRLGAYCWVPPIEMNRYLLEEILSALSPKEIETEVFAWGKLPLALSARCFTARHYNLNKDNCQFKCIDHPDGLAVSTQEGQAFLTINGIQTLSGGCQNLLPYLSEMEKMGIDSVRVSPQMQHTEEVLSCFHHALAGTTTSSFTDELSAYSTAPLVNGYWLGKPGIEAHAPRLNPDNLETLAYGHP